MLSSLRARVPPGMGCPDGGWATDPRSARFRCSKSLPGDSRIEMSSSGRITASHLRSSDEEFESLLAQWLVIEARSADILSEWRHGYNVIAAEEDALRARGQWLHGPDDTFGVLGLRRDELPHSTMIAWLLDPCGRHGLGPVGLREFLREAYPEGLSDALVLALPHARTRREEQRGDCRIDVVVRAGYELTLVVENKVDAPEGHRQCDAYFEAFKSDPGARFVFLTPEGRPPVSATGEAAKAFRSMSYRQLHDVLSRSLRAVDAPQPRSGITEGRRVVESYLRTLDREF